MKIKVLIIDDSMYMRALIKEALSGEQYEVIAEAKNGQEAIDFAFELEPDLITLDNVLPDMLGLDVLQVLTEENLKSKTIMISAVGQESVVNEGKELGALAYIVKPFSPEELVAKVNEVMQVEVSV